VKELGILLAAAADQLAVRPQQLEALDMLSLLAVKGRAAREAVTRERAARRRPRRGDDDIGRQPVREQGVDDFPPTRARLHRDLPVLDIHPDDFIQPLEGDDHVVVERLRIKGEPGAAKGNFASLRSRLLQ
jgi:hypothetical protein